MQAQKQQAVQDDAQGGGARPRQDTMADPLEAELGEGTVFGKKKKKKKQDDASLDFSQNCTCQALVALGRFRSWAEAGMAFGAQGLDPTEMSDIRTFLGAPQGSGVDEDTLLSGMLPGQKYFVVVGGSAEDHAVGMTPTGRRAPFSREEVAVLDRQGVFKWADSYTFWQV